MFNFAFVIINALLVGCGALFFGLKSVSTAGVLVGWDKSQIFIFCSYTFGLFALLALVISSILLTSPLRKRNKKILFAITICLNWILLVYLAADAFIYPLYRTHLNFAMIQMTFLGGGRIVWGGGLVVCHFIFQVGDFQKAVAHSIISSYNWILLFQPLLFLGIC